MPAINLLSIIVVILVVLLVIENKMSRGWKTR